MLSGTLIGVLEISLFFIISFFIKKNKNLNNINSITFYWCMLTILTGIWEFCFITNYKYVNSLSQHLIETKTHVWTNSYDLSYILPWKLSFIFYSEYGAYADREYMIVKDDWSRVIEGSHAILCGLFCLGAIVSKLNQNKKNYLVCLCAGMGGQLMNSILYLINYFIECKNPYSINFNSKQFPTGDFLFERPFMYVNIFWFIMPSAVILLFILNSSGLFNYTNFEQIDRFKIKQHSVN